MSGWAMRSAALDALTDPPYWTRIDAAASRPNSSPTCRRMRPHTSWASSGEAVRPVPMAQMGSYAMTSAPTCSGESVARPALT